MSEKLIDYIISEKLIALKFQSNLELLISLDVLRRACPCAQCNGEKDVFGNIYKAPPKNLVDLSFVILKINLIGHYAIRVFWKDGHSNGIYTFNQLKRLSE